MRLNLIGWAAVVAMCLAGAAIGYVGSRLVGVPGGLGVVAGVVAVLGVLLGLDRRRWARLNTRGRANR